MVPESIKGVAHARQGFIPTACLAQAGARPQRGPSHVTPPRQDALSKAVRWRRASTRKPKVEVSRSRDGALVDHGIIRNSVVRVRLTELAEPLLAQRDGAVDSIELPLQLNLGGSGKRLGRHPHLYTNGSDPRHRAHAKGTPEALPQLTVATGRDAGKEDPNFFREARPNPIESV